MFRLLTLSVDPRLNLLFTRSVYSVFKVYIHDSMYCDTLPFMIHLELSVDTTKIEILICTCLRSKKPKNQHEDQPKLYNWSSLRPEALIIIIIKLVRVVCWIKSLDAIMGGRPMRTREGTMLRISNLIGTVIIMQWLWF